MRAATTPTPVALAVLVGLAAAAILPVAVLLAFLLLPTFIPLEVKGPMADEEGRAKLSALLAASFDMRLGDRGRVAAAYEERDGFHGDGTLWFRVEMKPGEARPFVEALLERARRDPRSLSVESAAISAMNRREDRPDWWRPDACPDAKACKIENQLVWFVSYSDKCDEIYVVMLAW